MAETKHTPGPWVDGPPATGMDPVSHRYVHAGGELVARVAAGYLPNLRLADQLEANARLIAAAPELYDALLFYMTICGNTAYSVSREYAREAYAKGDAAIRKATEGA